VQQVWAGEYWWSDRRKENGTASNAVGIELNGNDHVVHDCVVFSSRIGVAVSGQADLVSDTHTWNLATGNGGVGILVNASQTRLTGNYLDWNNVVFAPAALSQSSFTGGFFLCGGHIQLQAPAAGAGPAAIHGLYIANNAYVGGYCHFSGYRTVEAVGDWAGAAVQDVTAVGAQAEQGIAVASTQATLAVTAPPGAPTAVFTANFTSALLFDAAAVPIRSVSYSVALDAPTLARHSARPPAGALVTVELDAPATGTVYITVDQSLRRGP